MESRARILLLFLLICIVLPRLAAQTNHLEKRISVDLNQVKLKNALPKIGESGGFQFSYNSEIIPGDSLVTIHAKDQKVKKILQDLVDGLVSKYRGKQAIQDGGVFDFNIRAVVFL